MNKKKNIDPTVGFNIIYYRRFKNLEQDQLGCFAFPEKYSLDSEKLKKNAQGLISKMECTRRDVSAIELYRIARILKIEMKKFFDPETAIQGQLLQKKKAEEQILPLKKIS